MTSRIGMRAGYRWRNSGHPVVTRAHTAWDTRAGARMPVVVSDLGGLSVAYAGLTDGLAYTLEFTELRRESADGAVAARSESSLRGRETLMPGRLPDADVVIVGTSAARARSLPTPASLVIPMRVHFVVDTAAGPEAVRAGISRRERQQFTHDRRVGRWTWEASDDPAAFDLLYDRMYRPTMVRRHGARQRIESRAVAYECLFRTGRMFFLCQDGQRVAGTLCHWQPGSATLTLRLLGVLDGADAHYDSGCLKGIYHYLLAWAAEHGVARVDWQGTEPFLSKGTFQWKRRLGSLVVLPPNHMGGKRLWLHVRRDSPAVRDFLVANPVLAESPEGRLRAVYFLDAGRPARHDYSAKSAALDAPVDIDLGAFLAGLPQVNSNLPLATR